MDAVRFNALVNELETVSRRDPGALRRRVRLLVALGYGYVGLLLLVLLAALALTVWITWQGRNLLFGLKIALVPLVLIGVVLKALWVRFDPPEGRVLTRADAPKLFQRVEQIRRKLKSPKADVVLLTHDFNASVTQLPRLGIFGWERTYLVIGLPLMYAVAPKHLDAVLAHEFGHISGAHPKFGLWVGRVGRTFGGILAQFQQRNWLTEVTFGRFFRWYVPRLNAHAFALSRNDEYAADRDAATVSGARASGEALASIEVRGRHYGQFWDAIARRVEHEPVAPKETWSTIPAWFKAGDEHPDRLTWFDEAISREGLVDETHPALRARLRALKVIGERPAPADVLLGQFVPPVTTNAAEFYLGAGAATQLREWDREWFANGSKEWEARHKALGEERRKIDAIVARELAGETLTPAEILTVATGLVQLDGDAAARPWLERAVVADPRSGVAHFLLGRAMLGGKDSRGIGLVEKAMTLDVQSVPAATELLRQYHASLGDRAAAVATEIASDAHFERLNRTNEERSGVDRKDALVAPTLSADDRAAFLTAARIKGVRRIWIAAKVTRFDPDRPLLVVIVEAKKKFLGGIDQQMGEEIWERIPRLESRDLILLAMDDSIGWLRTKMRKAGALCADGRTGTLAPRPLRWDERYRMPILVTGAAAAIAVTIGMIAYEPPRISDPRGIFPARTEDGLAAWLASIRSETKVDMRLLIDSAGSAAELDRLMATAASDLQLGAGEDGRGILLGLDATTGRVQLHITDPMRKHVPVAFEERVEELHLAIIDDGPRLMASLQAVLDLLTHRLREVATKPRTRFRPYPSPDSFRVAVDSATGYFVPTWTTLRLHTERDTVLENRLGATATAEEALARFQTWLSLGVFAPRARFLTVPSRTFYASEVMMTPALWDHLRHVYADRPMRVETRGDLAVAISEQDPLAMPLYFRRGKDGWQFDAVAWRDENVEVIEGIHSWRLARAGSDFDRAFGDLMVEVNGSWRFKGGANRELDSCGCSK